MLYSSLFFEGLGNMLPVEYSLMMIIQFIHTFIKAITQADHFSTTVPLACPNAEVTDILQLHVDRH